MPKLKEIAPILEAAKQAAIDCGCVKTQFRPISRNINSPGPTPKKH